MGDPHLTADRQNDWRAKESDNGRRERSGPGLHVRRLAGIHERGNQRGHLVAAVRYGSRNRDRERWSGSHRARPCGTMPRFRTTGATWLFLPINRESLTSGHGIWGQEKNRVWPDRRFGNGFRSVTRQETESRFLYTKASKRVVYLSTPGGTPEKLCEGCLRATDWSRDEKTLLMFGGNPYQVNLLDIAAHRQTPVLKHPSWALLYGRFRPTIDGSVLRLALNQTAAASRSRPSTGRSRFPKAPGSRSRKKGRRTGPTGRRTERRCTLLPRETDITVCGDSGSMPEHTSRWARRSPRNICTDACPINRVAGRRVVTESAWDSRSKQATSGR